MKEDTKMDQLEALIDRLTPNAQRLLANPFAFSGLKAHRFRNELAGHGLCPKSNPTRYRNAYDLMKARGW